MIDLRCHLIPGTGCGPQNFAESLEMCRTAASDGVSTIVATPLWDAAADEPPLSFFECREIIRELELKSGCTVSIRPGFVFRFHHNLPLIAERYGSTVALGGGRYLMVTLPPLNVPPNADEVWAALAGSGFTPIIARPECSMDLRRNTERLDRWVSSGIALQLDAASVVGIHGREIQRFALNCIQRYGAETVVVASNSRDAGRTRSPLGECFKELVRKVGGIRAKRLVQHTPSLILNGDQTTHASLTGPLSRSLNTFLNLFNVRST